MYLVPIIQAPTAEEAAAAVNGHEGNDDDEHEDAGKKAQDKATEKKLTFGFGSKKK